MYLKAFSMSGVWRSWWCTYLTYPSTMVSNTRSRLLLYIQHVLSEGNMEGHLHLLLPHNLPHSTSFTMSTDGIPPLPTPLATRYHGEVDSGEWKSKKEEWPMTASGKGSLADPTHRTKCHAVWFFQEVSRTVASIWWVCFDSVRFVACDLVKMGFAPPSFYYLLWSRAELYIMIFMFYIFIFLCIQNLVPM
jgi:hypothetical protein